MGNILIVDDERSVRTLLRAALETDRHHVFEASNGRRALECYRNTSVDLIITDLAMPAMDGFDLISELCSSFLDVKIIAMTGGAGLAKAKLLGARHTLKKPFPLESLLSAVRYELEH
jgi:two-component system response regulator (stage 0 sporulation protein F)